MIKTTAPSPSLDPNIEIELIRWRQARFERITEYVEDALPDLMAETQNTVASMSSFAASKAQISPDTLWKKIFGPWAQQVASRVEADMDREMDALAASLSENRNSQDALRIALPALAGVGVLAVSLAAISSVISMATVTTTSFFFITSTTLSWPILAVGGAGIVVATLTGSQVVGRLSNKNRTYLTARLQGCARTAALGYGLASDERCLVTDLQAFSVRSIVTKMEAS